MKRAVYKPLGLLCLALGAAGIVLPVLPSTPFVLLAAWFFARSSERWHRRLMHSELFGPVIRNWEEQRCISSRTKAFALATMLIAGGSSIALAMEALQLRIATAVLMAVGAGVVVSLKTCPRCQERAGEAPGHVHLLS